MIVYMYRWRIKKDKAAQFQENWEKVTVILREHCGSYGSRLHIADDGTYVGYAQWPDKDTRDKCKINQPELNAARTLMKDAVEEMLPDICLEIKSDFLIHPGL